MTPDESYMHYEYEHWACWMKLWNKRLHEFKSMENWYTSALHKYQNNLHCRQDILQLKFSFQHNLDLKTQVFDFDIIHFLKSRAHRGGMDLGELRFSNIVRIPSAFETIKFLLNNSCKTKLSALLFQLIIWVVLTWFHHLCKKIDNETTQLRLRHDHQVLSVDWGGTIYVCFIFSKLVCVFFSKIALKSS